MTSKDLLNIENLLTDAVIAAKEAGGTILGVYGSEFGVEQKKDSSPLTLADKRSHEIISGHLSKSGNPVLPVLSEEGRDIGYAERRSWEYYWLIDPLDGTKEFVRRNGEFTVNIALMQKDRPVLGVILVPVTGMLYFAAEGKGSFKIPDVTWIREGISFHSLQSRAVRLSGRKAGTSRGFTAIASRSHLSDETKSYLDELGTEHGAIDIISAGSSLKFCLIAEGEADIYPRFGPTMEWDTAAGQAIVEQAGGSVLLHDSGTALIYNKENLLNPWFIVRGSGVK
jgi:3'(2'), 5'-bisphosphate nucleotidase